MKKNSVKKLHVDEVLRNQRVRQDRKNNSSNKLSGSALHRTTRDTIVAPSVICLYKISSHANTTNFLHQIRHHCGGSSRKVNICFRNTIMITAAAGILLRAELERLVLILGSNMFHIYLPETRRENFGNKNYRVEQILGQIGILDLFDMPIRDLQPKLANVECWRVETGDLADSDILGSMINAVRNRLPTETIPLLYKGGIEALSNSVDHAYDHGCREDGIHKITEPKKWWMFTSIMNGKLIVLVCDLGVGIPNTIKFTQSQNVLTKLLQKCGFPSGAPADAGWIKTATLVKETRTGLGYRGKGGSDLRQIVFNNPNTELMIFSNKGFYKLVNAPNKNPEILTDHQNSIFGTIVQWEIKLVN